jgi:hypothetical protein
LHDLLGTVQEMPQNHILFVLARRVASFDGDKLIQTVPDSFKTFLFLRHLDLARIV